MKKPAQKTLLAHAVLASTLFSAPFSHADTIINGVQPAQTTAINGPIIEVATNGQILSNIANAVNIDSANGQLVIDAGNTFAGVNAVNATGAGFHGVNITKANGIVTVGALGGINANNAASGNGILVDAAGVAITNAGAIQSTNANGILFTANATAGNIINNGFISGVSVGKFALDLSLGSATLTQNAGTINGNILLAGLDVNNTPGVQNTFIVNGGYISADVKAATVGANTNLITLNGGNVNSLTLGNNGDTVNLVGTLLNQINGGTESDTLNITGGNFNTFDGQIAVGGGPETDNIHINANFIFNGTMKSSLGSLFIDVNNAGTLFTNNGTISNIAAADQLSINNGATMLHNGIINQNAGGVSIQAGGTLWVTGNTPGQQLIDLSAGTEVIFNSGTLLLGPTGILNVQANAVGTPDIFINDADAILQIEISGMNAPGGMTTAGSMQINDKALGSVALMGDSFIDPVITQGFVPTGSVYNIITVNGGGTILDNSEITASPSIVQYFTKNTLNNNILQLVARRNSFKTFSSSEVTQGVAGTLDVLGYGTTNADLMNVILQLDNLEYAQQIELAMESLIPPFNYGMIKAAHTTLELAYSGVEGRFGDNRHYRKAYIHNGENYGDAAALEKGSVWVKAYGAHLNQRLRSSFEGYTADAGGLQIGADWGIPHCYIIGVAGSYAKVDVDDKNLNPKDQNVKSWQGTLYTQLTLNQGLYFNGLLSGAFEKFDLYRAINIGNIHTSATAEMNGALWGAQGELGWNVGTENYFAPFAKVRYSHLQIDDYTETGAGGLNLTVDNHSVNNLMGGIGLKLGGLYNVRDIILGPELSALVGYDFVQDAQQTVAAFFGGGPAFFTNGVKPGRTLLNIGLGLDAHFTPCSVLGIQYDLEVRDEFVANAGWLKYTYLWG